MQSPDQIGWSNWSMVISIKLVSLVKRIGQIGHVAYIDQISQGESDRVGHVYRICHSNQISHLIILVIFIKGEKISQGESHLIRLVIST